MPAMTNEKIIEHICAMVREYDSSTGNAVADELFANPEKWEDSTLFPFYAHAAKVLIDCKASIDTKTSARSTISAVKKMIKETDRLNFQGIFAHGEHYCVCNGFQLLRLNDDISSIPHVKNDLDVGAVMNPIISSAAETIQLPNIADLKAYIAATKPARNEKRKSYSLDVVFVNPVYLLEMLQALPGCVAYKPKSRLSPIYFKASNGDGILMPTRV